MHWMCLAWGGAGNLLLAGVGGVGTGTVAWAPCADRTLAVADIDQTVMSCLRGIERNQKNVKELFLFMFISVFCPLAEWESRQMFKQHLQGSGGI